MSAFLKDSEAEPNMRTATTVAAQQYGVTPAEVAKLIEGLRNHTERQECAGGVWWETPNVCEEAASALEAQAAELAAVKEMYAREGAKALYELERAERAEAQLAEANKALEQAEQQLDYGQVNAAHRIIIRALLNGERKG